MLRRNINSRCRFLLRSACTAMGCLFHCFRARDSVSQPSRFKSQRGNDSKKSLSALFLSEEKAASSSPCHESEGSRLDSTHISKGLKNEAQFLESCGKIPATPIEISKASKNLDTPERGKHFGSSQFHSWMSSNSDAVFHLDEKTVEPYEEVGRSLVTSEQTPSSCLTNARNSSRISSESSDDGEKSIGTAFRDEVDRTGKVSLTAGNIMGKKKSVRFEFDIDHSYSSSSSKNSTSRNPEMAGKTNLSATLLNPTTLKLSDEIQTPGNIFHAKEIKSQFVHSVSNLNENTSLGKLSQDSEESIEQACKEKTENESPTSETCGGKLEESSDETYQMSENSVSPWLNQSKEKSNKNMAALSTTTPGDRPIIGMVALHWNEEVQSQISPKSWDGNGIPNSTNKYKEDQKVSWHATPFEERLEKALSEEGSQGFIAPRKLGLMEEAERDTAISQLHHSTQSKSVVSF